MCEGNVGGSGAQVVDNGHFNIVIGQFGAVGLERGIFEMGGESVD